MIFSIEHTGDSLSIPFLDASVSITQDGSIAQNSTSSPLIMESFFIMIQLTLCQDTVAYFYISRAAQVSSTQVGSRGGTRRITSMLGMNGYPSSTVLKAQRKHFQQTPPIKIKNKTCHEEVLLLPYISEAVTHREQSRGQDSTFVLL